MISLIAAVDKNFLMGRGSQLPWHLPADLGYFKKITDGETIVMGSKTFFSLPEKFRPLPNRKNIVLSRDQGLEIDGVEIMHSLENLPSDFFVIGGAEIYRLFLENDLVDRIYLTEIDGEFEGDVYFPHEFLENFEEIFHNARLKDEKNSNGLNFVVYKRKAVI